MVALGAVEGELRGVVDVDRALVLGVAVPAVRAALEQRDAVDVPRLQQRVERAGLGAAGLRCRHGVLYGRGARHPLAIAMVVTDAMEYHGVLYDQYGAAGRGHAPLVR